MFLKNYVEIYHNIVYNMLILFKGNPKERRRIFLTLKELYLVLLGLLAWLDDDE